MPIMIKFGDVFRFNEQEFVFLAQTGEITYAAKILSKELTGQVLQLSAIREKAQKKIDAHALYSFVMLQTPQFKGRMAHFKDTDKNPLNEGVEVTGQLNKKDLEGIKDEILDKNSAVPIKVKELVKDIS